MRDIDLSPSTMLEDFENERKRNETEMTESEEEGEREKEEETEAEEKEERESEERTEEDNEMGEEEEVKAFAAKIDNDKLTDRNIRFRDDYQKLRCENNKQSYI